MSRKKTDTAGTAEAEVMETPAETANADAAVKKAAEPLMYVGPTLTGIAIQNRVYTQIPDGAAALIVRDPELGNLFIPVSAYPKANKMLRERTGYIYRAYLKALKTKK